MKKNVYQLIFTQECRCFIFSLQIKLQKKTEFTNVETTKKNLDKRKHKKREQKEKETQSINKIHRVLEITKTKNRGNAILNDITRLLRIIFSAAK